LKDKLLVNYGNEEAFTKKVLMIYQGLELEPAEKEIELIKIKGGISYD